MTGSTRLLPAPDAAAANGPSWILAQSAPASAGASQSEGSAVVTGEAAAAATEAVTDTAAGALADPALTAIGAADAVVAVAASQPNWWMLLGLIYLGVGIIGYAAVVAGASKWRGSAAEFRDWAGRHEAHGVMFSALIAVVGLALQAVAQFQTMTTFGPTVLGFVVALMVIPLAYLFSGDMVGDIDWPARSEGRSQQRDGENVPSAAVAVVSTAAAAVAAAAGSVASFVDPTPGDAPTASSA
ncbi:MAG: hypothetical protein ACFCUN_06100 [Hyphomicrobiaceae bacterium]